MDILKKIQLYSATKPDYTAIISDEQHMSYRQLHMGSDRLAAVIRQICGSTRGPLIVYGHKSPYMILSMLACVKAGHAYCPVDTSMPQERVAQIIDAVKPALILSADPSGMQKLLTIRKPTNDSAPQAMPAADYPILYENQIIKIADISDTADIQPGYETRSFHGLTKDNHDFSDVCVHGNETFYIIFTSGSTGTPKGVEITADCLNNYLDWIQDVGCTRDKKSGCTFLNQAPFSFDLSVMDLYTCLASGGTLWTLSSDTVKDYRKLIPSLEKSGAEIWVSTPSFADICLADPQFSEKLMPELKIFLFCGETLTKRTATRLHERFPHAKIVNTYGPTESTVAVTELTVTPELCQTAGPLPVGRTKPGSYITIEKDGHILASTRSDEQKTGDMQSGEPAIGEIVIHGNTVAKGYFNMPEKTSAAFSGTYENDDRAYHTGDIGYLKEDMLYYCGRMDSQIKLNGYRIEIEDIENNLLKVNGIRQAVVLPQTKDGKVRHLTAFAVTESIIDHDHNGTRNIKNTLKQFLPEYMIPKKIIYLDSLPITSNGKINRKELGGYLQ